MANPLTLVPWGALCIVITISKLQVTCTPWLVVVGHGVVVGAFHSLVGHEGGSVVGAACRAGSAYPSGAPDFTTGFHRGSCCPVICVSLFHVLSFGSWLLILPFVWLLGVYVFYFYTVSEHVTVLSINLNPNNLTRYTICPYLVVRNTTDYRSVLMAHILLSCTKFLFSVCIFSIFCLWGIIFNIIVTITITITYNLTLFTFTLAVNCLFLKCPMLNYHQC